VRQSTEQFFSFSSSLYWAALKISNLIWSAAWPDFELQYRCFTFWNNWFTPSSVTCLRP
jgi:hypothetical protein